MTKKYLLLIASTAMLFMLSGCVQNDFSLPSPSSRNVAPQAAPSWNTQSSEEDGENIDISDLNEGISESELGMTEEVVEPKMQRVPFPVAEYNRLAKSGKGTVKGTIYVTAPNGNKVVGGGTRLYLNPVTSYSNQWYNDSYIAGNKMEKADARLFNYLKFTAAEASGALAFYGVPSASYYLIGTLECSTECVYDTAKSIRIASRVTVSGNNIVSQDLSRFVD
jgi:hypothetical protein